VQALLQQARAQSRDGNAAAALETLRRARELAPNAEEVLSAFAQLSLAVRAPVAALTALEPLSRMCPTVAEYRYLTGVAYLQAGALPEATDALRDAHRLEPDRALTLVALGLTLNGRKLYAEARPLLLRSLELEPENVDALAALAEAEEGSGDLEKADAFVRRALARRDAHATANLVAGLVLMRQERYAEARDAFLKAVAAEPGLTKAHYQVSLAYARLGDQANAEKHVELYRLKLRESEEQLKQLRMQR
jgi:tetratricopeptide (TPR) repeat protein